MFSIKVPVKILLNALNESTKENFNLVPCIGVVAVQQFQIVPSILNFIENQTLTSP